LGAGLYVVRIEKGLTNIDADNETYSASLEVEDIQLNVLQKKNSTSYFLPFYLDPTLTDNNTSGKVTVKIQKDSKLPQDENIQRVKYNYTLQIIQILDRDGLDLFLTNLELPVSKKNDFDPELEKHLLSLLKKAGLDHDKELINAIIEQCERSKISDEIDPLRSVLMEANQTKKRIDQEYDLKKTLRQAIRNKDHKEITKLCNISLNFPNLSREVKRAQLLLQGIVQENSGNYFIFKV
jgi:hypothetical protein